MPTNEDVARQLGEIADLLDLLGERFKPDAYRRAARSLEALPESLEAIAGRGELRSIPGVGEAIAAKVEEILRSGRLEYLERLRAQVPAGVLALMRLPGVGPKTARRFWVELGLDGPAALGAAIDAGRLDGVKGFAERKIGQLKAALGAAAEPSAASRLPLEVAWPLARSLLEGLRTHPAVRQAEIAGSFRRGRETVGDLDVLVTSEAPEEVFDAFSRRPEVGEVRLRGPTKETVILKIGLQVDLRVVEPEAFGAALQYFTGSKDHNVRLRSLARDQGLRINEYGVYRGETRVAGRTEAEVYAAVGLRYIPPELREDRGEIAQAAAGELPRLVDRDDLTAELHVHLPEAADASGLERLRARARSQGLAEVGVVAARVQGEQVTDLAPAGTGRTAEGIGPILVPVAEVDRLPSEAVLAELTGLGVRSLVLRSGGGSPPAPARISQGLPVRLIAHAGGTPEAAAPVLRLALALGAAVEVGPGAERFDSNVARVAVGAGVDLALPTGIDRPEDDPLAPVALAFARRAAAPPDRVRNARAGAKRPAAGLGSSGTPGRRARPKR
jgi:DNA polymerase (family X)